MMFECSGYCRRCSKRVYVLKRRAADVGDRWLAVLSLGFWRFIQHSNPKRYGLWQCDECGSHDVIKTRRVRSDRGRRSEGRKRRRVKRRVA